MLRWLGRWSRGGTGSDSRTSGSATVAAGRSPSTPVDFNAHCLHLRGSTSVSPCPPPPFATSGFAGVEMSWLVVFSVGSRVGRWGRWRWSPVAGVEGRRRSGEAWGVVGRDVAVDVALARGVVADREGIGFEDLGIGDSGGGSISEHTRRLPRPLSPIIGEALALSPRLRLTPSARRPPPASRGVDVRRADRCTEAGALVD